MGKWVMGKWVIGDGGTGEGARSHRLRWEIGKGFIQGGQRLAPEPVYTHPQPQQNRRGVDANIADHYRLVPAVRPQHIEEGFVARLVDQPVLGNASLLVLRELVVPIPRLTIRRHYLHYEVC